VPAGKPVDSPPSVDRYGVAEACPWGHRQTWLSHRGTFQPPGSPAKGGSNFGVGRRGVVTLQAPRVSNLTRDTHQERRHHHLPSTNFGREPGHDQESQSPQRDGGPVRYLSRPVIDESWSLRVLDGAWGALASQTRPTRLKSKNLVGNALHKPGANSKPGEWYCAVCRGQVSETSKKAKPLAYKSSRCHSIAAIWLVFSSSRVFF